MPCMRLPTLLLAVIASAPAFGDEAPLDVFPLRNHNPFLQIYGLPAFATQELVASGGIDINVSFDIANDMEEADRSGEVLIIDTELRMLSLSLRRRISERLEIGLDERLPAGEVSLGSHQWYLVTGGRRPRRGRRSGRRCRACRW